MYTSVYFLFLLIFNVLTQFFIMECAKTALCSGNIGSGLFVTKPLTRIFSVQVIYTFVLMDVVIRVWLSMLSENFQFHSTWNLYEKRGRLPNPDPSFSSSQKKIDKIVKKSFPLTTDSAPCASKALFRYTTDNRSQFIVRFVACHATCRRLIEARM